MKIALIAHVHVRNPVNQLGASATVRTRFLRRFVHARQCTTGRPGAAPVQLCERNLHATKAPRHLDSLLAGGGGTYMVMSRVKSPYRNLNFL